ncbi:hypothetical protein [Mongoliibacter sp.]|uniref:hypothetical protein n=1 Tax=Mongoliibacter sp. TaxID=2022438 RepID=UPI0025DBC0E2|nr:hypothetical protein [Mongoliibacter sp.]
MLDLTFGRIDMKDLVFSLSLLFFSLVSFAQSLPEEKVYAHLSKSIMSTGESVQFKVMVSVKERGSDSKMAYAELVDRSGQSVVQVVFPIENGSGENYISIPNNLASDHYLFRVYTRISPYLGDHGIFNQFITIINPDLPPSSESASSKFKDISPLKPKTLNLKLPLLSTNAQFEIAQDIFPENQNSTLSISLRNPYLPEMAKGYFQGEIYKKPSQPKPLIPEPLGHIVHAKTVAANNDSTETYFLSSHGKQSILNSAKPSAEGDLFFELGALKDYDFLIAQSSNQEKQMDFSPQSPFAELEFVEGFAFPPLNLAEKDKPFLQQVITAGKTGNYFLEEQKTEFLPIATGFVADRTYLLDDYNRFENIEVTLKEYIPEVLVRRQSRKMVLKVQDKPLSALFKENPLVLIDAMPVFDVDRLGKFDPEKIEKVEILAREFFLNKDRFAGVVSFSSFENDFGGFELPENSLYLNYWTIQAGKKYASPHLVSLPIPPSFPDFRSTLYWNSTFNYSPDSIFHTSETPGIFELRISFQDEKGVWQFKSGEFKVDAD